jgi:DNA-binding PadR family transcriptional regulator
MTWRKYGGSGWNSLGPMIAMMAAQAASEWDEGNGRRRARERQDWKDSTRSRKRRGRMFGTGELRLALLALINEEPRHGYELIRAIEDMTGGAYAPSPGAVYPTLQMLEEEGLIKQTRPQTSDDEGETGGKKPFKATKAGRAELEEREDEVEALMGRLGEHGERAERVREKSPDLFRAMGNLASVLKNRARAGKLDQKTIDEIVDIIDEVAKRIERL